MVKGNEWNTLKRISTYAAGASHQLKVLFLLNFTGLTSQLVAVMWKCTWGCFSTVEHLCLWTDHIHHTFNQKGKWNTPVVKKNKKLFSLLLSYFSRSSYGHIGTPAAVHWEVENDKVFRAIAPSSSGWVFDAKTGENRRKQTHSICSGLVWHWGHYQCPGFRQKWDRNKWGMKNLIVLVQVNVTSVHTQLTHTASNVTSRNRAK